MFVTFQHNQVLKSIVQLVSVNVVDVFVSEKRSS